MKRRGSVGNDNAIAFQFYLPAMLVITVFILFPVYQAVTMAFSEWFLLSASPEHPFIGFANFQEIFSLTHFWKMVFVTFAYTFFGVGGKMLIGLGTALMLNRDFIGRGFVRGIMIIPWAMPTVVACTVFLLSLDPAYGILNATLQRIGLIPGGFQFFSKPEVALVTVVVIGVWKYFPFVTLMLLAALQGISDDYYDAASIDGANAIQKFRHITWPLLQPVWRIVLILQIIWTIREFELVFLITGGGPDNGTAIIGVDIYLNAFRFSKLGAASAEGMFLLLFSFVFASLYFLSLSRQNRGGAAR